jgi:hypothetical protein
MSVNVTESTDRLAKLIGYSEFLLKLSREGIKFGPLTFAGPITRGYRASEMFAEEAVALHPRSYCETCSPDLQSTSVALVDGEPSKGIMLC